MSKTITSAEAPLAETAFFFQRVVYEGDTNDDPYPTAASVGAPLCSILLSERGAYTFPFVEYGCPAHSEPDAVMMNIGNEPTGGLGARPSGMGASPHSLPTDPLGSIAADGHGGSTVTSVISIAAGMYTATNTVGSADGNHNPLWPAILERAAQRRLVPRYRLPMSRIRRSSEHRLPAGKAASERNNNKTI
ncbi:MAG: hypothetical protein LBB30_00050 [Candidatus Methanoplasma sp.]|nr:hypothetical protein [Candidatus Methanoplasma sp.]